MQNRNTKSRRIESFKKVRRITTTHSSDRGTLFSNKSKIDGFVEFESLFEKALLKGLIHDTNCIDLESQPVQIPNETPGSPPYIPDAWAKYGDMRQALYDVKPESFFESLKEDVEEQSRWTTRERTIRAYCEKNGLEYLVVTENEIFSIRQRNVEFFSKNDQVPAHLQEIKELIESLNIRDGDNSRAELAAEIAAMRSTETSDVIPSIDHLIFHDYFALDFATIIDDDTILVPRRTNDSSLVPFHDYLASLKDRKETEKKNTNIILRENWKDPNSDEASLREFSSLPIKYQKEIFGRIELLKIFSKPSVTTEMLKDYAAQKDVSLATLYRWKKLYDTQGWVGLIPGQERAGR